MPRIALVLARFLAGRSPRMSVAFDGAEMETFAIIVAYVFGPFRRLPVYRANAFVLGFSATPTNGNEREYQRETSETGH